MKTPILLLFLISPFLAFAQEPADTTWQKPTGYLTFSPAISRLLGEFSDTMNKKFIWGFNMEVAFPVSKKNPFWDMGFQLEMFFPSNKKDMWDGIELKTNTMFTKINLLNRIRPFRGLRVEPYFDLTLGLNISSTETSYEVVDKATFLEKFLFDNEDEVETVSLKKFNDTSYSLGLGSGVIINKTFIIQVRYNYSPETEFVKRKGVIVNSDGSVDYSPSKSKMEAFTISVGFTLERAIQKINPRAWQNNQGFSN